MHPEHDERALSLSRDDLLDTAPCGFLSFADDGTIQAINRTLLDMLGSARHDVIGRHVETIFSTATRIFYQTHLFPLLRLHGRADELFVMLRMSSGEEIGALLNAARREHDDGAQYDCVLMRVRERQKYEGELLRARRVAEQARADAEAQKAELESAYMRMQQQAAELERARAAADQANQAKTTFLAVMSHELRTPLNAISGYVELLELGIHGPITDQQRDALERVRQAQRHLLRLINDLLNLSRIEAGHVEYDIADIDVAALLRGVQPLVEPQLTEQALSLSVGVTADLVVRADREKLEQILLNLLSNAIKFTPTDGRIGVDAGVQEDAAEHAFIAVSDTGIGIPADHLESVFEPFVQVPGSDAGRRGTGLGLAISRDLARGMGGDLHARSETGKGSVFVLTLPRVRSV